MADGYGRRPRRRKQVAECAAWLVGVRDAVGQADWSRASHRRLVHGRASGHPGRQSCWNSPQCSASNSKNRDARNREVQPPIVAQPYWYNIEPIFNQYGILRTYWPRYNDCILTSCQYRKVVYSRYLAN